MGNKKSFAEIIGRYRRIVVTITGNEEIKTVLKLYGYTDERFDGGVKLLEKVETDFEVQKKEYAEAYIASQALIEARESKKELFSRDMKLIRIAAKQNPELEKLIPSSISTYTSQEFYTSASNVYQNLANNPSYAPALASVGLKAALFAERVTGLKELDNLLVIRDREAAEADLALEVRDRELDQLRTFCMDLKTISRVALEDKPILKRLVEEL